MANTYSRLMSVTLAASSSTVTFATIPATTSGVTLSDIKLVISARGTATTAGNLDDLYIKMNNLTSGYTVTWFREAASAHTFGTAQTLSTAWLVGSVPNANTNASNFGNTEVYFTEYASTTKMKYAHCNSYAPIGTTSDRFMKAIAKQTSLVAITDLTLSLGAGSFDVNTTVDLYVLSKG